MHRIYSLTLAAFLTLFQTNDNLGITLLPDSSAGTRLAERFMTDLPSMGVAVLWQTEGSSSTATGSPKPPEFGELCKSSGEQHLFENLSSKLWVYDFLSTTLLLDACRGIIFCPEPISLISK